MHLDTFKSMAEVEQCVDMYIAFDNNSILKADREVALLSFNNLLKQKCFFRTIKEDEKIRGWILAVKTQGYFDTHPRLDQLFYMSDFSGFKAARAVILTHDAMIAEAVKMKLRWVSSHASHLDTDNTLCKILERRGWQSQGYLVVRYLDTQ